MYVDFTNLTATPASCSTAPSRRNRNVVNPATKRVLLKVAQPFDNHNGGQLQIGPDGLLYISLGDGGRRGDPNLNGQSKGPLSTILRIDLRKPHPRAAMYAYGLRNPWRFSFDRKTGGMWIGDVGQDTLGGGRPPPPRHARGHELRLELLRGPQRCSRRSRSTARS